MADSFLGDIGQTVGSVAADVTSAVGPRVGQAVGDAIAPHAGTLTDQQQQITDTMNHLVEVLQAQHDATVHVIDSLPAHDVVSEHDALPIETSVHDGGDLPCDVAAAHDAPAVEAHVDTAYHVDDGAA